MIQQQKRLVQQPPKMVIRFARTMVNLGIRQMPLDARNIPSRITVRQSQRRQRLRTSNQDLSSSADSPTRSHFGHTKRLSNSSSGFVETVKTASFSKASINIGPRSHRLTRSTETRGNRSSNVRYSLDSDRPITRPSLDEGALRRRLRRRQILREMLMSEESYLVDLRALSNLFSTLLTSIASFQTWQKPASGETCLKSSIYTPILPMNFIECQRSIFPCIGCQNVCFGSPECVAGSSVAAWICTIFRMESRNIRLTLQIQMLCCEPQNQARLLMLLGLLRVSWLAFSSTRTTAPTTK